MLENLKILSFTHYLQGPSGVQILADLGADVFKVERLTGSYERSWSGADSYKNGVSVFFLLGNRNQRSLAIDLKTEEGKQIIYNLVKTYDIVITNFRPGVMEKLGFSYEKLKEINSRVIYCSCSGWGESGPYIEKDGQDVLAQGISGLVAQNGPGDHIPYAVGSTVVDVHGGALAALGLLAAVHDRIVTGKSHKIETNLLNSAIDLQMEPLAYFLNSEKPEQVPRASTGLATRIHAAVYGAYKTKNGCLVINCRDPEKIAKAFGDNALEGIEPVFANRYKIDEILSKKIQEKTTAEWIKILSEYKIRFAEVNEYPDVVKNPQVVHNKIIMEMEHPVAGKVKVVNHPNYYDGEPLPLRQLPPDLGAHSCEVLKDCGYSAEEIEELFAKGIIAKNHNVKKECNPNGQNRI
jgi:crotonobetainyl-CoA:carnitine CoA-transferase CaiB-like acyl-CoA transferase